MNVDAGWIALLEERRRPSVPELATGWPSGEAELRAQLTTLEQHIEELRRAPSGDELDPLFDAELGHLEAARRSVIWQLARSQPGSRE